MKKVKKPETRPEHIRFYTGTWKAPIVPVGHNKHPVVPWKPLQSRLNTAAEMDDWFVKKHPWGIAVIMGAISGNLFDIDIDDEQLFLKLQPSFPPGACIARSQNGHYHVVMRAQETPFSIPQHHLPDFDALCIRGEGQLAILPDTPGREWLALHDDPATVDQGQWIKEHLGFDPSAKLPNTTQSEITIPCLFHDDHSPSLSVNVDKAVYYCHGCGAKGTVGQLLAVVASKGVTLPEQIKPAMPHTNCQQNRSSQLPTPATEAGFRVDWRDIDRVIGVAGQDIIEGLLPGGSQGKLFVSGERKLGKTTLGLTLGIAIAQGTPALGKRATVRSRVMFVDLEGTAQSVADVMRKQVQALGEPEPGWFDVVGGEDFKVTKPESIQALWSLLEREPRPEVVIFDSVYALVSDINDVAQAGAVLELLTSIITKLNAAVIVLHHVSDPSELLSSKKPLGVLGRQLDRWSGVTANYLSIAGDIGSYYRLLDGLRRGGQGRFRVYLCYLEDFQTVVEIEWEDVPGSNEERRKLLGTNPRVRTVQQTCALAKLCGVTVVELAAQWEVDRRQIYRYLSEENIPPDDVFQRIQATERELKARAVARMQGARQNDGTPRHTSANSVRDRGPKEGSFRLSPPTVCINNTTVAEEPETTVVSSNKETQSGTVQAAVFQAAASSNETLELLDGGYREH